ncbi:hypothetical protein B5S32_g4083 [[Candida] boidinii]|nr:hypothetical protein B5S32_g4083 [[Candida] boidinii]
MDFQSKDIILSSAASVDLALVSTVLAGVKRSTGLTPNLDSIQDENIKGFGQKYLGVGEYCYDSSVAFMSASSYFQRK